MTTRPERSRRIVPLACDRRLAFVAVVAAAVLVAGCQGNAPTAKPGRPAGFVPSAPGAYKATVGPSVVKSRDVKGYGRILADYRGLTIYTNNGPADSKVARCTGSCTTIWHPVLVDTATLSDPRAFGVRISVLPRPGGGGVPISWR